MSPLRRLRALLKQRLDAADEIFVLFERIIADFEEELTRFKERERRHKLLDAAFSPEVHVNRYVQQLLVSKGEDPPEWIPGLDQKHRELLHIKEEQHEVWTRQGGEQLNGLEEPDISRFSSTAAPDEEKPQSSQLHQSQPEDIREAETPASGSAVQMKANSGEKTPDSFETQYSDEDWQEPLSDSGSETKDSNSVWKKTRAHESVVNALKHEEARVLAQLDSQTRIHAAQKPFGCSVCGKHFTQKIHAKIHMRIHTGERPFSCDLCGKCFYRNTHLRSHMRVHTKEKPFACSVCSRRYKYMGNLKMHMKIHAE